MNNLYKEGNCRRGRVFRFLGCLIAAFFSAILLGFGVVANNNDASGIDFRVKQVLRKAIVQKKLAAMSAGEREKFYRDLPNPKLSSSSVLSTYKEVEREFKVAVDDCRLFEKYLVQNHHKVGQANAIEDLESAKSKLIKDVGLASFRKVEKHLYEFHKISGRKNTNSNPGAEDDKVEDKS